MRWRRTCISAGYFFALTFVLVHSNPIALGQIANGIFVTPLAGAPFTAISTIEDERTDPDGATVHLKSSRAFARDSQGRIYKEARALQPFTQDDTPRLLMVVIYDPQTKTYTYLYPQIKAYWKGTLEGPIPLLAREYFYGWPARYGPAVDKSVKQEDLGAQTIDHMTVRGVRQTGRPGTGVAETDEYWYTDELGMNLLARCTRPGKTTLTVRVTQITRTEPDAALFEIPSDYRRKDPYTAEVLPLQSTAR